MVKRLCTWAKGTELWIILAQIYCVLLCPYILKGLICGGSSLDRYVGMGALALVVMLVLRYEIYRKASFFVYLVFFLFTYISGFISSDVSILRIFGSPEHRAWYICLLAYLISYNLNESKRDKWIKIIFSWEAIILTTMFTLSVIFVTKNLLNPEFKVPRGLGSLVKGRLSVFGNPNTAGQSATVLILISLILIYYFWRARYRIIALPLCFIGLIVGWISLGLSYSRSAMLATAAAVGTFFFVLMYRKSDKKGLKVFLKAFLICVVACAIAIGLFLLPKKIYDSFAVVAAERTEGVSVEDAQESLETYGITYALDTLTDRTLIWPATVGMLNEKPIRWITGITAQRVHEEIIYDVYEGRPEIPTTSAHSGYVQQLYTYGIPGATLLAILLISWLTAMIVAVLSGKSELDKAAILAGIPVAAILMAFAEAYLFPNFRLYPITFFFFTAIGAIQGNMAKEEKSIKGKIVRLIIVLAVLSAGALLTAHLYAKAKAKAEYVENVEYEPQNPADFVRLNNSISEEMMSPDYWLKLREDAGVSVDTARLSFSEIAKYNYDNRRMIATSEVAFSLDEVGEDFYVKTATQLIKDTYFVPEHPENYYLNDIPTDKAYWDTLLESLNLEALDSRVSLRFGYSVTRGVLKRFPTDDEIYGSDGNLYYDELIQSDLQPFMPVAILHESKDGEWYYVLTYGYGGWTRIENVAVCESKEDWADRKNPQSFLVVTGKELRLSTDPYTKGLSDLLVPMGTVLPVVSIEEAPEDIHNRISFGNYIAKLPTRGEDGFIEDVYVLIPASEDVNLGYLPYTEENVAKLSFKHLGAVYGWGGAYNGQDCSGYVREVYACFGFNLPRAARTQADYACEKNVDVTKMSVAEKIDILNDAPIGTLVFFPGHIMMYMGTVDGVPYCISSAGNFSTIENGTIVYKEVNTVILTNMADTKMADGRAWIESITKITIP
ncbi:MAG: SH3 domain-containing protein [Lachnospiraceae bacterium]|nr:SH3 domain-containing protein [Lachnospiraceae bacterium]